MKVLANTLLVSKNRYSVTDHLGGMGVSDSSIEKTIEATGFHSLSRFENTTFQSLVTENVSQISRIVHENGWSIKALVVVTQTNTVKIPNAASFLQGLLGLPNSTLCYEIVDGCNGFVKALKLIDGIMLEHEVGLVVSGDFNSLMVQGSARGTSALFGDGFAFTIVEKGRSFQSTILQDGSRGQAIRYGGSDPSLFMDGFEVFAFATKEAPKLVSEFISSTQSESTEIVLHQASKLVVEKIHSRISLPGCSSKPFSAGQIGNLGPASLPGWLAMEDSLAQGSKFLVVGYGAGLSWGVAELEWNASRNEVLNV
jgi:3-oxoacyl-[acyl-carrier-protein] synthase-3